MQAKYRVILDLALRPALSLAVPLLLAIPTFGDETDHGPVTGAAPPVTVRSQAGANAWNAAQPPADWWAEIRRQHGHVGPWNVLGWRIGQAALRELHSTWGRHELEVICYVPLQTPFTCLVDGLSVGTGNTLGRLDLRLAEVLDYRESFVAVRRKDQPGTVLEFRPDAAYLKTILNQPVEKLEALSRECGHVPEEKLFRLQRFDR